MSRASGGSLKGFMSRPQAEIKEPNFFVASHRDFPYGCGIQLNPKAERSVKKPFTGTVRDNMGKQ
jgi:hypothetical protein